MADPTPIHPWPLSWLDTSSVLLWHTLQKHDQTPVPLMDVHPTSQAAWRGIWWPLALLALLALLVGQKGTSKISLRDGRSVLCSLVWSGIFQSAWWLSHPSEKYESHFATFIFPIIIWKKHVPNHQPAIDSPSCFKWFYHVLSHVFIS